MRTKESVFRKNFLTVSSILLISFMVLALAFTSLSYQLVNNEKQETMIGNAEKVAELLSAVSVEENLSGLPVRMAMMIVSETTGYQILVCDSGGTVVSETGGSEDQSYIGKRVSESFLTEIMRNGSYYGATSLDRVYNATQYVVGMPVVAYGSNTLQGFVFISGTFSSIDGIWRQSASVFAISALTVLIAAFIICMITTRRQVEPINQMAYAAHKFAKGDFSIRVTETDRQDEIGELAEAFNTMADSLEQSETRRREFIANVSHELKTPMTTIAGFADGILDGTIPEEKQSEYLRIISSETRRLSRLVRSMLDMSQHQGDANRVLKEFDLSEVVCQAILSLEKKILDHGLDVDVGIPEEPVKALGDADAITQVVYNLIDNAAKFAEKDSVIKIELWKQNSRVYVSVENRGETISKDELPLIFERFHKTDRSRSMDREGVGLGLYIVKTIMDSHNGDIFVTSEDGITKFTISLELASD